jgi:MFS superfamily sulfate permease-like transporter
MESNTGLTGHLKDDALASVVVFLVALPLCLGIALASGASLFSGIISGVIGGIVVGFISKSPLGVSGPAAGLVLIVLNAVDDLGSFEAFLVAVVIAGLLQIAMGLVKIGIIGLYFPSSVIKGMLAAIGIILILKQIPHLVGFDVDAFGEMEFFQEDGDNTFTALLTAYDHIYLGSLIVGFISFGVLLLWGRPFIKKNAFLRQIPAGLMAVLIGVLVNLLLGQFAPDIAIESTHLVNLPVVNGETGMDEIFTSPDWTIFSNPKLYLVALTLALIASLETLLSLGAVDKLDPEKRQTPPNRELIAQGVGNTLSGLIGGLPITAVIVRSSANLDAGAKSKLSTILHGVILLLSVIFIPGILNKIPYSSLAAILILVGYKLTKPALYKEQFGLGWKQFIPFIVTVLAILFSDLLIGILIGLAVGVFYILKANYKVPFSTSERGHQYGNAKVIQLSEHVSFLNKPSLIRTLDELPSDSKVVIDGSSTQFIDFDVLEVMHDFLHRAKEKNITVRVIGISDLSAKQKENE